jgi:UDP-3-O-[3-hydroxymyristoyl] glucosamine N-acyltransferase
MMPSSSLSLADWLGGSHHGEEVTYSGLASLETAGPKDVSFLSTDRRTDDTESAAGLLLVKQPISGRTCICVDDPKLAFIRLIEQVFPVEQTPGTSDGAHVDAGAFVDATATLHAGVVVMERCSVGAHTVLFPNVVLYPDTTVGAHCRIHAGAVIGADGFSYHPTAEGPRKVPQVGRVVIDDGVEIGANSTIDRAFMGETRVGAQTKIDNLVHVGHNCQIGSAVLMAAQSGLSGSVSVSDRVMIGGQAGVVEHAAIGTGARVGAQSGVVRSVEAGETVLGTPAEPAMKMKRIYAKLRAQASKPD